ncbi:SufS family cysteine desulfurase [Candidatus Uhrbacteria bacterium]|nr:SufS family cysteine desulfurase [Candidatus Uhrbacteria bacterium]
MQKLGEHIKKQFPIFSRRINGHPLVYLDNASTSQKPRAVIDALSTYYKTMNANIHRGIHTLSEEATDRYEQTRTRVARFLNAASPTEIIFTRGCTESINLVAATWAAAAIRRDDKIIVSALEHHANLVPWQELARKKRARLDIIPLTAELTLDEKRFHTLLSRKTKLVCLTSQSNVLGTVPPLRRMIKAAHTVGARVLVDAAQSVGHSRTNVHALDCDFLAFSSHKMLGPTGVGVLYAKKEILEMMPPYQYGGDMVESVAQRRSTYRPAPWKFEAGTPNIADVIAFASAIDFLEAIGFDAIQQHDADLLSYARSVFANYHRVQLFVPEGESSSVLSFTVEGVHPHDVATVFDVQAIAIRSGLHCAEPLVRLLGVEATARMSFYLYNTRSDIDRAARALEKVFKVFSLTLPRSGIQPLA